MSSHRRPGCLRRSQDPSSSPDRRKRRPPRGCRSGRGCCCRPCRPRAARRRGRAVARKTRSPSGASIARAAGADEPRPGPVREWS
ncbi:MAG: hypothetical protein EOP86_22575, partial [Verrucomicrobiaceae bacterium]